MKIAVIGKGKQAAHTAAAFALCKDCQVFFYNTSEGVSRTVEGRTEDVLLDRVERKRLSMEEAAQAITRLVICPEETALYDCDLVVEMSRESRSARRKELKKLAGICSPKTVFAIGTFSLDADWERSEIGREVIGMGFFRERFVSDAVELIASEKNSQRFGRRDVRNPEKAGKTDHSGPGSGRDFLQPFCRTTAICGRNCVFSGIWEIDGYLTYL